MIRREFTMSKEKTAITDEQAKRNLVNGWIQKGKWDKVYELAASGDETAIAAIKSHNKKEEKKCSSRQVKKSHSSKKVSKVSVDYSKLEGPAKAGQHDGGGQSLKPPPVPKGHGKKTNVGNAGNRRAPVKIKEDGEKGKKHK
jgi:hypothetical protein